MTRSIFDPTGGETERSGSTFGPEDAGNRSKMPVDSIDGTVSQEEASDVEAIAEANRRGKSSEERLTDAAAKTNPDTSLNDARV